MRMSSTTILCFLFLGLFVYTEQLATDQKKKKLKKIEQKNKIGSIISCYQLQERFNLSYLPAIFTRLDYTQFRILVEDDDDFTAFIKLHCLLFTASIYKQQKKGVTKIIIIFFWGVGWMILFEAWFEPKPWLMMRYDNK